MGYGRTNKTGKVITKIDGSASDFDVWSAVKPEHLWVMDKLIVAKMSGHLCGPKGSLVPASDTYIVRPVVNPKGMGLGASFMYLIHSTSCIPHGYFWCEIFSGDHLSVDYLDGEPVLTVMGIPDSERPLQRFTSWKKVENSIPLPKMLHEVASEHRYINCEFIGGKLIEVHLRHNPDFAHNNTEMIPVWLDKPNPFPVGYRYIPDEDSSDDLRTGIWVR